MRLYRSFVRLVGAGDRSLENRAHFFGVAAKAMRHVLVDHARARGTLKRGEGQRHLRLDEAGAISPECLTEMLALDGALTKLAALSPRQAQVVELRFFGQCSVNETANAMGISEETVLRDWRAARAWLYNELRDS
jgi:RNA polymerase sigma factor (TIGR02999 family)